VTTDEDRVLRGVWREIKSYRHYVLSNSTEWARKKVGQQMFRFVKQRKTSKQSFNLYTLW